MEFPHDLAGGLNTLTQALDQPGTDLQAILSVLIDDLRAAVPSFLGLTMTLPCGETSLTLTVLPPAAGEAAATSLMIPLQVLNPAVPAGAITFFAGCPGAFVDLAADSRWATGSDRELALDEHLPSRDRAARPGGVVGLAEASIINQAIGALINRGHTTERASRALRRHADRDGISLHRAAEQLLAAVCRDQRRPAVRC